MNRNDFELFCMKLWGIWKDRCNWIHKPNFVPGCDSQFSWGAWTDNFFDDFHKAQCKLDTTHHPLIARYTTPLENDNRQEYTIFVDAAYCDESHSYATGFAIYDPGGYLRVVGFQKIPPTGSVMAAEVQTIYNGLTYGERNFSGSKRIFSDSLEASTRLAAKINTKGLKRSTFKKTKRLMEDSSVTGVWYCKRVNNILVHNLAKDALLSAHPHDWMDDDIPGLYKSGAPAF